MGDFGCTGQVQFSRFLFCGLHNLILFRPMPHTNRMIGFESLNDWFLHKTKIVLQTNRFHSLDWRFCAIRKKVVCCLSPKRLQNLKLRKWMIFRIFGFVQSELYIGQCNNRLWQCGYAKDRYFVWNSLAVSCVPKQSRDLFYYFNNDNTGPPTVVDYSKRQRNNWVTLQVMVQSLQYFARQEYVFRGRFDAEGNYWQLLNHMNKRSKSFPVTWKCKEIWNWSIRRLKTSLKHLVVMSL